MDSIVQLYLVIGNWLCNLDAWFGWGFLNPNLIINGLITLGGILVWQANVSVSEFACGDQC
jgi:hypothetical protein